MADVHVVYALTGDTRGDLLTLLFDIKDEGEKAFNIGWGHIVSVGALDEGLSLEIEDGYQTSHDDYVRRSVGLPCPRRLP